MDIHSVLAIHPWSYLPFFLWKMAWTFLYQLCPPPKKKETNEMRREEGTDDSGALFEWPVPPPVYDMILVFRIETYQFRHIKNR